MITYPNDLWNPQCHPCPPWRTGGSWCTLIIWLYDVVRWCFIIIFKWLHPEGPIGGMSVHFLHFSLEHKKIPEFTFSWQCTIDHYENTQIKLSKCIKNPPSSMIDHYKLVFHRYFFICLISKFFHEKKCIKNPPSSMVDLDDVDGSWLETRRTLMVPDHEKNYINPPPFSSMVDLEDIVASWMGTFRTGSSLMSKGDLMGPLGDYYQVWI